MVVAVVQVEVEGWESGDCTGSGASSERLHPTPWPLSPLRAQVLTLLLDLYIEGRQLPRAVAALHRLERLHGPISEAYGTPAPVAAAGAAGAGVAAGPGPGSSGSSGSNSTAGPAVAGAVAGVAVAGGRPRELALPRVSRWGSSAMASCKALLDGQVGGAAGSWGAGWWGGGDGMRDVGQWLECGLQAQGLIFTAGAGDLGRLYAEGLLGSDS